MCCDVRIQETCAEPIGEAPLAHPILDVRLTKGTLMTSTIKTMSKNEIGRSIFSFM